MLEVRDITKIYNPGTLTEQRLFEHFSLTVDEGQFVAIVGSNGSGKTSLLNIICGSIPIEGGDVLVGGRSISKLKDYQRYATMGRVYQDPAAGTCPNLTMLENLSLADNKGGSYGLGRGVNKKRIDFYRQQLASLGLGLEDKLDFYVDGLSRGMKQRLCLARALIHDPAILILDEPTSGLDPRTRFEFKEILSELRSTGKTIIISSHVLSELSEMCTDIGIIDQGRMVLEGNITAILSRVNASNPLVISVYSNMEQAMAVLRRHPCVQTISMREKDICVRFAGDGADEAMLLQQLIDAGVLVNGFVREKGSLESVFMQLTDHEEERVVTSYEAESGLQP